MCDIFNGILLSDTYSLSYLLFVVWCLRYLIVFSTAVGFIGKSRITWTCRFVHENTFWLVFVLIVLKRFCHLCETLQCMLVNALQWRRQSLTGRGIASVGCWDNDFDHIQRRSSFGRVYLTTALQRRSRRLRAASVPREWRQWRRLHLLRRGVVRLIAKSRVPDVQLPQRRRRRVA